MMAYIYGKRDTSDEKWFVIMADNTVKVFNTLSEYGKWWDGLSEAERDNISKWYTTLNEKDKKKLKELNLI